MADMPPMYTASWRRDYSDGSGPELLVEVTPEGAIAITQHDSIVINEATAVWLYAALLPAIRALQNKGVAS